MLLLLFLFFFFLFLVSFFSCYPVERPESKINSVLKLFLHLSTSFIDSPPPPPHIFELHFVARSKCSLYAPKVERKKKQINNRIRIKKKINRMNPLPIELIELIVCFPFFFSLSLQLGNWRAHSACNCIRPIFKICANKCI